MQPCGVVHVVVFAVAGRQSKKPKCCLPVSACQKTKFSKHFEAFMHHQVTKVDQVDSFFCQFANDNVKEEQSHPVQAEIVSS